MAQEIKTERTETVTSSAGNHKRRFSLKNIFGISAFSSTQSSGNSDKLSNETNIKMIKFTSKPMGFRILAKNGVIKVSNVTKNTSAYDEGIKVGWVIKKINNTSSYLNMLNILTNDNKGPYNVLFITFDDDIELIVK
mmetsp:Transcript_85956/g.105477  ORF Transcript_85956/g.105477 Transcript_85956/m.105477 type:complete len:137 (-) Transcript_85956:17-427(-)